VKSLPDLRLVQVRLLAAARTAEVTEVRGLGRRTGGDKRLAVKVVGIAAEDLLPFTERLEARLCGAGVSGSRTDANVIIGELALVVDVAADDITSV